MAPGGKARRRKPGTQQFGCRPRQIVSRFHGNGETTCLFV
jgi:hypothetical protein